MARKSKRAGGNLPLTHYERTKKFASSEYGTTTRRLSGAAQYQLGDCALSLTPLDETALCSPSGYLYSETAILEYLLTHTQRIKEEQAAAARLELREEEERARGEDERKVRAIKDFENAQRVVKTDADSDKAARESKSQLLHASYWLPDAQPQASASNKAGDGAGSSIPQADSALVVKTEQSASPPPDRPSSPHSGDPLRRSDLWPVQLHWQKTDKGKHLLCAVSEKVIHQQEAVAYWTSSSKKKAAGVIMLQSIMDTVVTDNACPLTGKKIVHVRKLQRGGSSFATSTQNAMVKQYRPTIT
jgi:nitric oxide synthase-interacting protein